LSFQFPVSQYDAERRSLWLSVWHSDMFGRNDFLGETTITLAGKVGLHPGGQEWFPLQERVRATTLLCYRIRAIELLTQTAICD
jgi:hypothetical protein